MSGPVRRSVRASSIARSSSSSPLRTRGSSRAPAGVSCTTRPLRLNRVLRRYSSRERICMLTAPAVMPRALAARVNESCSATATNTRRLESGSLRNAVGGLTFLAVRLEAGIGIPGRRDMLSRRRCPDNALRDGWRTIPERYSRNSLVLSRDQQEALNLRAAQIWSLLSRPAIEGLRLLTPGRSHRTTASAAKVNGSEILVAHGVHGAIDSLADTVPVD